MKRLFRRLEQLDDKQKILKILCLQTKLTSMMKDLPSCSFNFIYHLFYLIMQFLNILKYFL